MAMKFVARGRCSTCGSRLHSREPHEARQVITVVMVFVRLVWDIVKQFLP